MKMFSGITDFFENLANDPASTLITLAYIAVCIFFSLILHECAHGWVALKCGDPTAKMLGRLTLNPAKHLDPFGTVCMLFLRVGWAKPVPINPRNFRHYRRDYILVSLAGIVTNLLMCFISLIISALLCKLIYTPKFLSQNKLYLSDLIDSYHIWAYNISEGNIAHALINSDGSVIAEVAVYIQRFFLLMSRMNLGLAVFNLIPIPPLDGYRFLDMFVFKGRLMIDQKVASMLSIGFMVLLLSGVLDNLLMLINSTVLGLLCNVVSFII